ncbi:MAG: class I SAM-dependent methyltransferase [Planctomycetes bacterium]|nr:class I SAM-dependent methyltransferase [Planctomycetota bacterium]
MRRFLPYEQIPLTPFLGLPRELWSEEFFRCGETVNLWVDVAVEKVLSALGLEAGAVRESIEELAARARVPPDRLPMLRWLFDWVEDAERTVGIAGENPPPDESTRPTFELLSRVTPRYAAFLRGEEEGERILFSPGTLALWESYFSNCHAVVRGLNALGAHAALEALSGKGGLRILEVGGGLGSAAAALLEGIAGRTACYLFTDVHPGFLRRGGEALKARFPGVPIELARLDLNGDLSRPGAPAGGFDLIYGANALHLAGDLLRTLKGLKGLLAPGGRLIFVEGTRPAPHRPIAAEFAFQLLPQFTQAAVDPEFRPRGGFLSGGEWLGALRRAGFRRIESVPDLEPAVRAYPNHAMGAFVAS